MGQPRLLVVTSNPEVVATFRRLLAGPATPWVAKITPDPTEALEWLVAGLFRLVLLDSSLPTMLPGDFCAAVQEKALPVGVVTFAHEQAPSEPPSGALDHIDLPLAPELLAHRIVQALVDLDQTCRIANLEMQLRREESPRGLVAVGATMPAVLRRLGQLAQRDSPALIIGEQGTGRRRIARALHARRGRQGAPLVIIPCADLPEFLLDLELFGQSPECLDFEGTRDPGAFQRAAGGTLILDRIDQISPRIQTRLLDHLRHRRGRSRRRTEVPARIVATASPRIDELAAQGRFRRDLIELLEVGRIELPTLAARGSRHVARLIRQLENRLHIEGHSRRTLGAQAIRRLASHPWPGNIPQLRAALESLLVARGEEPVSPCEVEKLLESEHSHGVALSADSTERHAALVARVRSHVEKVYLRRLLGRFNGRVDRCAAHSGLSRKTIGRKLRDYGMSRCRLPERSVSLVTSA